MAAFTWIGWQDSLEYPGKIESDDDLTPEVRQILLDAGKLPMEDSEEVKAIVKDARSYGVIRNDSGSFPKRD